MFKDVNSAPEDPRSEEQPGAQQMSLLDLAPLDMAPPAAPAESTEASSDTAQPNGPLSVVSSQLSVAAQQRATDPEQRTGLVDWKAALRTDFERWLASLEEIPDADDDGADAADGPDLYSFYEQLAATNVEARKANRRTAEAFSQWGETLGKFDSDLRLLREHLARQPIAQEDALPHPWCLALIEIVDRLHRLAAAFAVTPAKAWWGGEASWRKAWETQRRGFDILLGHIEALLTKAGIARMAVLHQPFDPATMSAVSAEPSAQWPPQTVLEEVTAGYRLHGELLRVAQVKVSTAK